MKVLYITANPKQASDSTSLTIGGAFMDAYRAHHPDDAVTTLDLCRSDIAPLTLADLSNMADPAGAMQRHARQFAEYDKYIIASPMWNLGIPAVLKAYIDHIMVAGVLFKYGVGGVPRGLLQGKKACVILSRGGVYRPWPLSLLVYDKRYLKRILRFIGIRDISFIVAEGTELHRDKVEQIRAQGIREAQDIASEF
ncbi:MAG: NAD(P)H-dependent oxidoreductase [Alphaproteobacteria bacterium]|nr:NAD(P)H-dependent oxidoreductase [Alphaproteobacteria bacterium]